MHRIIWIVCLIVVGLSTAIGFINIDAADSAMQQGAAANMACFWIVGAYALAQTISELRR